jgi:hypothetical protein
MATQEGSFFSMGIIFSREMNKNNKSKLKTQAAQCSDRY